MLIPITKIFIIYRKVFYVKPVSQNSLLSIYKMSIVGLTIISVFELIGYSHSVRRIGSNDASTSAISLLHRRIASPPPIRDKENNLSIFGTYSFPERRQYAIAVSLAK